MKHYIALMFPYHTGTCKIERNCTATMKVTTNEDSTVDISMCYTHYGHQKELQHTWLTKERRKEIAAQIQRGVSKDKILHDIRNNVGTTFYRHHLVSNEDLKNIKNAFGLNEIQRHPNDQQSVLSWIKEWEASESNPVLFYKLQGEPCEDESLHLQKEDFMIIIQSEAQKTMAKQFGKNGICCDSTHGTNGYDFLLTSMLVVDEFGEGVPVAWCISNREDYSFMKIFFSNVKTAIGPIPARWFMSDKAPQYYDAFVDVNGHRPKKLLCTWHVDKAWKEELRSKVPDSAKQAHIYTMLRTLLEEIDELSFNDSLDILLQSLASSVQTKDFHDYFQTYWLNQGEQWAYCYRLREGINTNMFVEAFHRVFKYKYMKGKVNKRLDSCLFHLIRFIRDQSFERIIKLTKGKSSKRIALIHDRHRRSLDLPFTAVEKNGTNSHSWLVQSSDGQDKYPVNQLSSKCNNADCMLRCNECNICCHMYQCQCPDSLINCGLCKHIHLVHPFLTTEADEPPPYVDVDPVNDVMIDLQRDKYVDSELQSAMSSVR